jgi:hypothetical protein
MIEELITPEIIGMVATVLISFFGVKAKLLKDKLSQIAELTIIINDAVYDDKVSAQEIEKISDALRKLANK